MVFHVIFICLEGFLIYEMIYRLFPTYYFLRGFSTSIQAHSESRFKEIYGEKIFFKFHYRTTLQLDRRSTRDLPTSALYKPSANLTNLESAHTSSAIGTPGLSVRSQCADEFDEYVFPIIFRYNFEQSAHIANVLVAERESRDAPDISSERSEN